MLPGVKPRPGHNLSPSDSTQVMLALQQLKKTGRAKLLGSLIDKFYGLPSSIQDTLQISTQNRFKDTRDVFGQNPPWAQWQQGNNVYINPNIADTVSYDPFVSIVSHERLHKNLPKQYNTEQRVRFEQFRRRLHKQGELMSDSAMHAGINTPRNLDEEAFAGYVKSQAPINFKKLYELLNKIGL